MISAALLHFKEHDRRIFWVLASLLGAVLAAYIYFLGISVYAVIERKTAEKELGQMNARISQLESTYVALDREIDLVLARERGFADVRVPQYVLRGGEKQTFTLRGDSHSQ